MLLLQLLSYLRVPIFPRYSILSRVQSCLKCLDGTSRTRSSSEAVVNSPITLNRFPLSSWIPFINQVFVALVNSNSCVQKESRRGELAKRGEVVSQVKTNAVRRFSLRPRSMMNDRLLLQPARLLHQLPGAGFIFVSQVFIPFKKQTFPNVTRQTSSLQTEELVHT